MLFELIVFFSSVVVFLCVDLYLWDVVHGLSSQYVSFSLQSLFFGLVFVRMLSLSGLLMYSICVPDYGLYFNLLIDLH